MTDARTLDAHYVTYEEFAAGQRAGRYGAVCGVEVLVASMITEERSYCRHCLRWRADQCS